MSKNALPAAVEVSTGCSVAASRGAAVPVEFQPESTNPLPAPPHLAGAYDPHEGPAGAQRVHPNEVRYSTEQNTGKQGHRGNRGIGEIGM